MGKFNVVLSGCLYGVSCSGFWVCCLLSGFVVCCVEKAGASEESRLPPSAHYEIVIGSLLSSLAPAFLHLQTGIDIDIDVDIDIDRRQRPALTYPI